MICQSIDERSNFSPPEFLNYSNTKDKNDVFAALSQQISNFQENNSHVTLNRLEIPAIDSDILFQSSNLLEYDEKFDSSVSTNIPFLSFSSDCSFFSDNDSIGEFNTKQFKLQPQIQIINYFKDLIQREIKAPNFKTKEELFDFIQPYSIENYAINHFRKQNNIVLFGLQSIEELTTFSMKPLSKPLLEKIPIAKKDIVYKLSTLILTYVGIFNSKKQDKNKVNLLISIICILHDDNTLVDEFFMQIIKIMRKSPNHEILLLSWQIFLIISSLFVVKDPEVSNVIRWFLIHNIYEKDIIGEYANYTFIRFYERSIIGRNFHSDIQNQDILNILLGVQNGNEMFKCSLYTQMWNQKREYPNLPIPLTLYLTVKALIKNGVMITKHPFPDLGQDMKCSAHFHNDNKGKEDQKKSVVENKKGNEKKCKKEHKLVINDSNERNKIKYKKEHFIKNNENTNRNTLQNHREHRITNDENKNRNLQRVKSEHKRANDENANRNIIQDGIKIKTSIIKVHNENDVFRRNEKIYQYANMKIVKMWAAQMNEDHSIINDGEVRNLLGLIFIWMLNLPDPIIPKYMCDSFIKLPIDDTSKSYNSKYKEFVENMPLLHRNTLKYLIGFLREIAQNNKWTHETHETIADNFGSTFVKTSFITIDPFTRKKMYEISPHFLRYCLDNLDVKDVYPLNPVYENHNDEQKI